jgi:putative membrane protein
MRTQFTRALLAALALAVFVGAASARQETAPKNDKEYLIKAIAVEEAEVTIADLAAKNATNEDVRKLAKKISEDHTKSRDALTKHAKDMKIGIVAGLTKDHRQKVAKLRLMKGNEFDKTFIQHVIDSHTSGEKMYEKWSTSTKDAELKKMATKYQTGAKDHLKKAKELQKKLGE